MTKNDTPPRSGKGTLKLQAWLVELCSLSEDDIVKEAPSLIEFFSNSTPKF